MKRIIIAIAVLMAFGMQAQEESMVQKTVAYGAKGGLNIATITGGDTHNAIAGLHVGAFAEITVTDKFFIQPELLFSKQGAEDKSTFFAEGGEAINVKQHIRSSYINVPVMAKYYVSKSVAIMAGPQ